MKCRIITYFCIYALCLAPMLVFGQVPPAPVITGFFPIAQCSGGTVTIVGQNFANVQSVRFGGTSARTFVVNATGDSIRATLGQGSTGVITVQTTLATTTSATTFTFLGCPPVTPVLIDVQPFPLIEGDRNVEATMRMANVCACLREGFYIALEKQVNSISFLRDTIIPLSITGTFCRFIIPARFVIARGNIRCNLNQGTQRVLSTTLTVTARQDPPRINSILPSSTTATGQAFQVRIEGTDFIGNPLVILNRVLSSVECMLVSTSSTHLLVNVPAAAKQVFYRSYFEIFWANTHYSTEIFPIQPEVPLPRPVITSVRQVNSLLYIAGMNFMTGATITVSWEVRPRGNVYRIVPISVTPTEIIGLAPSTTAVLSAANGYGGLYLVNPDGQGATWSFLTHIRKTPSTTDFRLYPNPAHETVTIEIDNPKSRTVTLVLRNTLGQELIRLTKEMPAGRIATPLEVGRFPAGTYFLEIQSGSERVVERFVKY